MKAGKSSETVEILPSRGDQVFRRLVGHVLGGNAADQLDELHLGRRIHEVDADEPLRPIGRRGQTRDRDRRGVGGEQRLRLEVRAHHREDAALDLLVLGSRLDHQVAVAECGEVRGGGDARERRLGVVGADLALLDEAPEASGDPVDAGPRPRLGDVVQEHIDSGEPTDLSDAGPHLAGPDHTDLSDIHHGRTCLGLAAPLRRRLSPHRHKTPSRPSWQAPR